MVGEVPLEHPIFFQPNRVWRCYSGGYLLDQLCGRPDPHDGPFPEEWLASTTRALNGPDQQHPEEGLSRVRLADGLPGPLFADVIAAAPEACLGPAAARTGQGVGVLCKFLDSAVRLPIQCHPDRAFARQHYHSEHGKEEAWLILGTRRIAGQDSYLLLGFKPHVDADLFAATVQRQDVFALEAMLHRFPVRPGDAYIIPGRFPHAIGPGVFLLEVQEPTDWVVQPEEMLAGRVLSDTVRWGPLTPEVALACFDYQSRGRAEEVRQRVGLRPQLLLDTKDARRERIVGPAVSTCFSVDRLTVVGAHDLIPDSPYHLGIVAAGEGTIETAGKTAPLKRGDAYFASHAIHHLRIAARKAPLQIYLVSV
jgi:mannose-6-phosphate isomerase